MGWLEIANQRSHQRGLTGAVATHKSDSVGRLHAKCGTIDKSSGAYFNTEVACYQHDWKGSAPRLRVVVTLGEVIK